MSEVFNVLEQQPPLGEGNEVMTGRGIRCLSDGHFCWDDESGDDYENDIPESFFWSYDTQLEEQCLTAHEDFIINSAKNNLIIKDVYKKNQKYILQWIDCNYIIYNIRENDKQQYVDFEFYNKDGQKNKEDVSIIQDKHLHQILPRFNYNLSQNEKYLIALSKTNEYKILYNLPNINKLPNSEPWGQIKVNDFVLKTNLGFFSSRDFGLEQKSLEKLNDTI